MFLNTFLIMILYENHFLVLSAIKNENSSQKKVQKSIRPKTKKRSTTTRVWTTGIFRYRQKSLEIHERTDKKQKDTSESIGNSCPNSHTSKNGGGENDDVEKK